MKEITLDRTDYKIIQALENDGRLSNTQLAETINLSQSQCLRRLRQLEEMDIISGYRAQVNYQKLGYSVMAWTLVTVSKDTANARENVMFFLQQQSSAISVHGVTGDVDLMVEIYATDMTQFTDLVVKQLYAHADVVSTKSYIRLDTAKQNGSPLDKS
ncbi:Lrp/AsnC family transcriptional regulator [Marinomonas rhizomae]|uniref:DNA-binding Lrp family transcriptional regulator n=1 Tax=Marinomonas rhizomae TaxID=491948 RepID=A0A366JGL2_9GAMM|nr:Lrp/AsnC family transcriptional regulator [Marinomonas rhizomae]RBP85569.1 DNA-binding Lrp family transcriptional regulator [Marinomonas rhizomae]RNF75796.1 Lrp/AsnC family transcriptional regulator [Marinomonas rhizomae]